MDYFSLTQIDDKIVPKEETPAKPVAKKSESSSCPSDIDLIKQAEGFRPCMYYDDQAVRSICYGQSLLNARTEVEAAGGSYEDVMAGGCLSETQCTAFMQKDVERARRDMHRIYGNTVTCPCA